MNYERTYTTDHGRTYLNIRYNAIDDYLLINWLGYISPQFVMEGSNAIIEAAVACSTGKFLSDKTSVQGTYRKTNVWLEEDWFPRAMDAGLKFGASLLSENIFSQMSSKDLEERVKGGRLTYKNFKSMNDAVNWLKDKKSI
ncbi:hypothetical protein [Microscilla marina]|uniref:STAS/SEC14 domain-containing protein n=1 Tax=Microscilla marina ATCC 23134 TaxID=313606 RepID=A1ZUS6_MICM2|nr:hypothetical protein [Microscilla marina]EAY25830.1 hypothetical protein M23134_07642 [Microscilla marina ATCC 23134]